MEGRERRRRGGRGRERERFAGSASGVLPGRVKDREAVLTQCFEGCKRCKTLWPDGTDHRANQSNGNFTDDHEHKLISGRLSDRYREPGHV